MIDSSLREIIFLNINSIFYPSKTLKSRLERKNHLFESVFTMWPFYIIFTVIELIVLLFLSTGVELKSWLVIWLLFKSLIFPISILVDATFTYFVMRVAMPTNVTDSEIMSVIGNTINSNCFLVIPLIGSVISLLVGKVLLFHGSCFYSNWKRALLVIILPSVLSMIFVSFFLFCLALSFLSLVSIMIS